MRTGTIAIAFAALGMVSIVAAPARADGLRCGSKLVSRGDTRASVHSKCGEPADITHKTLVRRPSYLLRGHLYYGEEEVVDVENWTYNFGPSKFMRRVRFVDGIVDDVETLDYGYHE